MLPLCFLSYLPLKSPKMKAVRGAARLGCEIQHRSTQEHLRSCHRKGPWAALPFLEMSHTHPQRAHGCGAALCGSRSGDRQPADVHWQQHLVGGQHAAQLRHRNRSMNPRQHWAGSAGQPWAQPAPVPCLSFPSLKLRLSPCRKNRELRFFIFRAPRNYTRSPCGPCAAGSSGVGTCLSHPVNQGVGEIPWRSVIAVAPCLRGTHSPWKQISMEQIGWWVLPKTGLGAETERGTERGHCNSGSIRSRLRGALGHFVP